MFSIGAQSLNVLIQEIMVTPILAENSSDLLDSEITVLGALALPDPQVSQRLIARRTGYSIGLINAILKKLAKSGYIKIVNLNKRQLQYLLTPKGFAAASLQAYSHLMRTVKEYQQIQQQLSEVFCDLYQKGYRSFCVNGEPALKDLVDYIIKDLGLPGQLEFNTSADVTAVVIDLKRATVTADGPRLDFCVRTPTFPDGVL